MQLLEGSLTTKYRESSMQGLHQFCLEITRTAYNMIADYTRQIRYFCITENTVVESPARDGSWLGVVSFFCSDRNERGDYSLRNQLQDLTITENSATAVHNCTCHFNCFQMYKCTCTHMFNLPHNTG